MHDNSKFNHLRDLYIEARIRLIQEQNGEEVQEKVSRISYWTGKLSAYEDALFVVYGLNAHDVEHSAGFDQAWNVLENAMGGL